MSDAQPKHSQAGKASRKLYVRKVTEARREQNKRAQKLYRDRQKKRLEELEEKAEVAESTHGPLAPNTVDTIADASLNTTEDGLLATGSKLIIDLNRAFEAAGDLKLPAATRVQSLADEDQVIRRFNDTDSIPSLSSGIATNLAPYFYLPTDPDSEDLRHIWPLPDRTWSESYKPPPKTLALGSVNSSVTAQSPILSFLPVSPFNSRIQNSSNNSSSSLPSPYLNHLQLVGESCFGATLSVALSLGISRSSYVNDHPSPWTAQSAMDLSHIKPDLRPTFQQLNLLHPCYLDCIIFPTFRSKAIELSSRGELDHSSFFLDLMHDGLVCWGSAFANAIHGRTMGDGVAWSRRSWEARPWFISKWGWLIGGSNDVDDEDEIRSGSEWWRVMRGEKEQSVNGSEVDTTEELGFTFSKYGHFNVGLRNIADVVSWD